VASLRMGFVVAVVLGVTAAPAFAASTVGNFSFGQLQASTVGAGGCGTNTDGEPAIEVSRQNQLFLGSERGIGGGSDGWRLNLNGGLGDGCSPLYSGQPNAVAGFGASGGDIDVDFGNSPAATGNDPLYVASLNLGTVYVAHSTDNGKTFTSVPAATGGIPVDDREWIAAYGATTSLLTYHDIGTGNIDVLRSDNGGLTYQQTSTAIPATDYRAMANELGNIAIDRINTAGATLGQFWAYQSYVAPSSSSGSSFNEAFLAVSNNGGSSWTQRPIPCSTAGSGTDLDHNFPNVAVDPAGTIWYAWSDDHTISVAHSSDHGQTWTCETASNQPQSIFPWLAPGTNGVDLVYYGTPTAPCSGKSCPSPTWSVEFAQRVNGAWSNQQLMPVHSGTVCEGGINCTSGRNLFDDFGVDIDQQGLAHIAYSQDSPSLGGSGTSTGYAVQTGGTTIGTNN
jgi:hypothetical protein